MNWITIYLIVGILSNIFFVSYFNNRRKYENYHVFLALITIPIFPLLWVKFIKEIELPIFNKIKNKVDVVFNDAEPIIED